MARSPFDRDWPPKTHRKNQEPKKGEMGVAYLCNVCYHTHAVKVDTLLKACPSCLSPDVTQIGIGKKT